MFSIIADSMMIAARFGGSDHRRSAHPRRPIDEAEHDINRRKQDLEFLRRGGINSRRDR